MMNKMINKNINYRLLYNKGNRSQANRSSIVNINKDAAINLN